MQLFFLIYLSSGVAQAAPALKHVASTDDGIVVRARIDEKSGRGETLAKGLIKAPVSKVWALLNQLDSYSSFMPFLRTSRVVKRNKDHVWQYLRTDTPVASDRDYTLKFSMKKGSDTTPWKVGWVVDNTAGPKPIKGVVRVSFATGSWTLTPAHAGRATQAVYRLKTHPGGSIPSWLAHMGNKRAIPDIIRAVRKKVQ